MEIVILAFSLNAIQVCQKSTFCYPFIGYAKYLNSLMIHYDYKQLAGIQQL